MTKRIFALLLVLVLFAGLCPSAFAIELDDPAVYIKQSPRTCTLASATMLLRRKAILDGDANWDSITESAVRKVAWAPGLYWNFSYNGVNISVLTNTSGWMGKTLDSKKQALIRLLEEHPEGIVAYDRSYPHAVLLTHYDYETGTFYCSDPVSCRPKGIIPLANCTTNGVGQDGKLAKIDFLWYAASGVSKGAGTMPTPAELKAAAEAEAAAAAEAAIPKAHERTQAVAVDNGKLTLQLYTLQDDQGNDVSYVKLRDIALVLNGTPAQFGVGYDGAVSLTTGEAYQPDGTEMTSPFSGDQPYTSAGIDTRIDGEDAVLNAIQLNDEAGGGYTYYNLRDLGQALGFTVSWDPQSGIRLTTDPA